MNKYKITVEYDGTNYVGWQRQKNGNSIQGCLEHAIEKLFNEKVTVYGAGRTDAGVHALQQIAHFSTNKSIECFKIRDGLNQHLRPNSISILNADKAAKDFHARFSAKLRCYEYKVINRRPPLTIDQNKAWCIHKNLNLEKIIKQASFFEGKHDFQSFRSIDCQSKTTLKSLESFEVKKNKDILIFSICAKSFLHSQVRIMVGTLVDIGKGLIKESILDIIKSQNRAKAGMTAPSYGLYLKKIEY